MIRLFFIRHGETDWNRQRKLQGHTDIPLNPRGREQAESLRPIVQAINFDFIYSSDLSRARQTAELSFPGKELRLTPLLREINLGRGEGETREWIQEHIGSDLWEAWSDLRWPAYSARFPEGESRREGLERLFKFFSQHRKDWPDGAKIACFSHGLLLRSFAQWCADLQIARFTTPNCCVFEWRWRPADLSFEGEPEKRPHLQQIHLIPDEALTLN